MEFFYLWPPYDTMSAVTISEKKVKQFKERRLSIDSRKQAQCNETESAVFKFCRFSLFLKDLVFFQDKTRSQQLLLCHMQLVEQSELYLDIVFVFFHILVLQEYWVLTRKIENTA